MWHFWLPGMLVLVAFDGTAALAASALLRAAAARSAREWAHEQHERPERPASAPPDPPAQTYAGQAGIALVAGESPLGGGSSGELATSDSGSNGADAREASALEAERKANAALNIGFAITFMLGPALARRGGARVGSPVALLIDAASFLICGAMLIDLHPHVEELGDASVRARLRAAWEHINDVAALRMLLLTEGFALIFFASRRLHRGRLRQGGPAGRRSRLRRAAGRMGAWRGRGERHVRARRSRSSLVAILSVGTLAVGLAYLGWAARAVAGRGLRGGAGRRDRQRHAVGGVHQRRAATHAAEPAWPDDGRGGIARRDLSGDRPGAWRHRWSR